MGLRAVGVSADDDPISGEIERGGDEDRNRRRSRPEFKQLV
jgi:hypothetical protein